MPCTRSQELDLAEFAVDPRAPAWDDFRHHYLRCAECSREVARFASLAAALAAEGSRVPAHPSEASLVALARSRSTPDERARIEAHLAGCAPCRTELSVIRGFDFAVVAEAPVRPRSRDWLAGLRMPALWRPALVTLALVLAIPAAILLWQRAREGPTSSSPPIAKVEPAPPIDVAMTLAPPVAPPVADDKPEVPAIAETLPPAPTPPEPAVIAKQLPEVRQPPVAKSPPVQEPEVPPEPPRPIEIAALLPAESPLYSPGALASGPSVRIGGASRSVSAGAPAPEALGPAHVGVTTVESPNLYWFLPEATPSPIEVTVVDPGTDAPLLETTLTAPLAAGVHRVNLSEHGVRLKAAVDYRWFVAMVRDPARRSQDIVSGAAIRFTPPASDLSTRLSAASAGRAAHVYAESGVWYDAFDQLSRWLETEPGSARLHEHRAALLEQVGLGGAAAFEKRSASGER